LDGPTFSLVAETASRLGIFIAVNHPTLIDDKRRNTTVLFDRSGAVAGLYHKSYPTIGELEHGCTPGDGPVVLDTELGRIGFAICYDLNFPELRLAYAELCPDLILFSSMFRGGLQTRWWAYETRSYFVSSVVDPSSRIINPVGRIVREITGYTQMMTTTVELDFGVFHLDYNAAKLEQLRRKYGRELEIDFMEAEGVMLISAIGDTPLASIVADLELESLADYLARAEACRARRGA
jgi:predicted amidohydrolase